LAFLTQNKAKLCKNFIITSVFEKNANVLPKLAKFAENCDHNIDPKLGEFLPTDWTIVLFGTVFLKSTKVGQCFGLLFSSKSCAFSHKMGWVEIWVIFFTNSSGHAGQNDRVHLLLLSILIRKKS
jgi:hypothetical protein